MRTAAYGCVILGVLLTTGHVVRAQNPEVELQRLRVRLDEVLLDAAAAAQTLGGRVGGPAAPAGLGTDPTTGPVVNGSPFSADAATTVVQTLGDGTRIEQRANAKFFRDGPGRVRRELTVIGLDALNPSAQARTVITFDSVPGDPQPFSLDPVGRTARRVARGSLGNAWFGAVRLNTGLTIAGGDPNVRTLERAVDLLAATQQLTEAERAQLRELERSLNVAQSQGLQLTAASIPGGLKPILEQLGTRQIEGVKATGRKTTVIIPTDRVGNDRPMQITDERWESPELSLVVYSRYSDPRTGVIEYKLTNIRRAEPAADLFQVPSDYTVIEGGRGGRRGGGPAALPPPPEPGVGGAGGDGARGGARQGGRGGRSPQ
jgi:hypothetical protein